jgi:hypothetical protein
LEETLLDRRRPLSPRNDERERVTRARLAAEALFSSNRQLIKQSASDSLPSVDQAARKPRCAEGVVTGGRSRGKQSAMFNDGIGIVLFTVLLRSATSGSGADTSPLATAELLLLEAGGGLLLGVLTGYLAYSAMRLIDEYSIEVLISLALVTGTYALARRLDVSGPLSVVAAGLLIGDRGPRYAMSERTQTYLFGLWRLIDEILNSVLFLLIGLEVLVLRFEP